MISVAIIEDNEEYRIGLETYLNSIKDINLVFSDSCLDDIKSLVKTNPNVVIMDINLGKQSGIEGIIMIKDVLKDVKIFMLTTFENDEMIFNSLKAGAIGYMLKKDRPGKILEAIRNVNKGEAAMNGHIAHKVVTYFQQSGKTKLSFSDYNLTKREKEILQYLIDGLSYKEIAATCFISTETINSHIKNIYSKLNVRSRAEINARFIIK